MDFLIYLKKKALILFYLARILFIFLQAATTHIPLSAVAPAQIRRGCVKKCPKYPPCAGCRVRAHTKFTGHRSQVAKKARGNSYRRPL